MRPVALLDVNVLVALLDADHVHHDAAHDWFAGARQHGLATFDTSIPVSVVLGATPTHLLTLAG